MSRRDELVAERDKHRAEMKRILDEQLTQPFSSFWLGEFGEAAQRSWNAQLAIDEIDRVESIKNSERERVLAAIESRLYKLAPDGPATDGDSFEQGYSAGRVRAAEIAADIIAKLRGES